MNEPAAGTLVESARPPAPPDEPDAPIEPMPPSGPPVLGFRRSTDPSLQAAAFSSSVPPETELPVWDAPATIPSAPPSDVIHEPPSSPHAADDEGWAEEPPSVTVLEPQPEPRPTLTPSVELQGDQTLGDALIDLGPGEEEESSPDASMDEATVVDRSPLAPENAQIFEGSSGESTTFPTDAPEPRERSSSPSVESSGVTIRVGLEAALHRLLLMDPANTQDFVGRPITVLRAAHTILLMKTWPPESADAREAVTGLLEALDPGTYEDADLQETPWNTLRRVLVAEIGKKNSGLRDELDRQLPPVQPSVPPPAPPAPPVSRPPPLPPSRRRGPPPKRKKR